MSDTAELAALEAQIFRLTHRNAMLSECIRIGNGLASALGYSRGYTAGRSHANRLMRSRATPSPVWTKSFPLSVMCRGRHYQVINEQELDALLLLLVEGRLALANRYRVAGTKVSRWKQGTP
jgi:hypothetical protein